MKIQFCAYCGTKLDEGACFCKNCGEAVDNKVQVAPKHKQKEALKENSSERKIVYDGYIHKCPSCGEVLKAFEMNCSACGYELRGMKVSSAVKEFALKLEGIEAKREYEKPRGLFATAEALQRISKADEQKISLIKNFSVPNSKEDMLEFMILATSNINMNTYDSTNTTTTKAEKEVNAAWFSKVQQVYEKARRSYSTDSTFAEIKVLYDGCNERIKESKRKGLLKYSLMFGWMPIVFAVVLIWLGIYVPLDEKKEVARLDAIVEEIESQLEEGKYKYALMNADGLVYSGAIRNDEQSRRWKIIREYWIDIVIDEAAENGVILARPEDRTAVDSSDGEAKMNGFIDGVKEGIHSGTDTVEENVDEFNRIINGEATSEDQNNK